MFSLQSVSVTFSCWSRMLPSSSIGRSVGWQALCLSACSSLGIQASLAANSMIQLLCRFW